MNKAVRVLITLGTIMPVLFCIHANVVNAAYTPKTVSKLVADVDSRNPSIIGRVPEDSGKFAGHAVSSEVKMINYAHEEIQDRRNLLPNELFDLLKSDLENNYTVNSTATIIAAEYFVDTDPGEGIGTAISSKDGSFDTTTADIGLSCDTSNLTIGIHNLYVRMESSNGLWGTPRKISFEVTGDKKLSAAEYYIDTDPGDGNGTPMSAEDGAFDQGLENISVNFDTSGLATGLHTLYVRVKNSEGHWGTPNTHKFEVMQPPIIEAVEYFFDATDPGTGNGTAINAEDGSFNSTSEALLKSFSTSSLGIGTHTLNLRAKDSYQRWGAIQSITLLNGYQLSVTNTGTGTGTVTSGDSPQGINCGSDCTEIYNGQNINLTATADPGFTFISWTGCTSFSGNTCTVLMTADKPVTALFNDIAPVDTAITSKPDTLTNSASASFTFTATKPHSTFECQLDNGVYVACATLKAYSSLTEGSHTFAVRATDPAGNTDATPAIYTWTVDTIAPTVAITSPVTGPGNNRTPKLTYSVSDGTVVVNLDGKVVNVANNANVPSLADGGHTVVVESTDATGNKGNATIIFTVDVTPPALTLSTLADGAFTNNSTLNVVGTVSDASGIKALTVNDVPVIVNSDGNFSHVVMLSVGSNTVATIAIDNAGNQTTDVRHVTTIKSGDCDGNGIVTIAEVQSAINMFLGIKTIAGCVDLDNSGTVSIAEVQKVINAFLGL